MFKIFSKISNKVLGFIFILIGVAFLIGLCCWNKNNPPDNEIFGDSFTAKVTKVQRIRNIVGKVDYYVKIVDKTQAHEQVFSEVYQYEYWAGIDYTDWTDTLKDPYPKVFDPRQDTSVEPIQISDGEIGHNDWINPIETSLAYLAHGFALQTDARERSKEALTKMWDAIGEQNAMADCPTGTDTLAALNSKVAILPYYKDVLGDDISVSVVVPKYGRSSSFVDLSFNEAAEHDYLVFDRYGRDTQVFKVSRKNGNKNSDEYIIQEISDHYFGEYDDIIRDWRLTQYAMIYLPINPFQENVEKIDYLDRIIVDMSKNNRSVLHLVGNSLYEIHPTGKQSTAQERNTATSEMVFLASCLIPYQR